MGGAAPIGLFQQLAAPFDRFADRNRAEVEADGELLQARGDGPPGAGVVLARPHRGLGGLAVAAVKAAADVGEHVPDQAERPVVSRSLEHGNRLRRQGESSSAPPSGSLKSFRYLALHPRAQLGSWVARCCRRLSSLFERLVDGLEVAGPPVDERELGQQVATHDLLELKQRGSAPEQVGRRVGVAALRRAKTGGRQPIAGGGGKLLSLDLGAPEFREVAVSLLEMEADQLVGSRGPSPRASGRSVRGVSRAAPWEASRRRRRG